MKRWPDLMFYALLVLLLAVPLTTSAQQPKPELIKRGAYLAYIGGCRDCHTPGILLGKPDNSRYLAGESIGFRGPWGTSYPKNLTPDDETGLGKWTEEEIIIALRLRVRKNGRPMLPLMPTYGILTYEDAMAIVVYLKSLKPVKNQVPENLPRGVEPKTPYLTVVFPEKK